jgi:hypothetical protein
MTAGITHQAVDSTLDARQCGIVRGRARVVDDSIDQLARSLRLAVNFGILGIVQLLARLVPDLIGRILHFCDHHPAKRESSFKR